MAFTQRLEKGVDNITKLAKIRKARGLTQEGLATLSGVHRVSIARYETGKASPNVRNLEKLSVALKVKIDELVDRKAG